MDAAACADRAALSRGGWPPLPLETRLRVYFLQNGYALCNPMAFGGDRIPDETTILNYRHLPDRQGLTEAIFADVNAHLADKGITLRSRTLVDATIIDAPSSTKVGRARDPEMSSTKKGNIWYFGMKAHLGVDAKSGVTHSLETSTAKVMTVGSGMSGEEISVWADKRYVSAEREAASSDEGLGREAQGAEGQHASPRGGEDQQDHRDDAGQGRRPLPLPQAAVWLREDPLSGTGQEPRTALHAIRPRQPIRGPKALMV
jgi:hypothetical protein